MPTLSLNLLWAMKTVTGNCEYDGSDGVQYRNGAQHGTVHHALPLRLRPESDQTNLNFKKFTTITLMI